MRDLVGDELATGDRVLCFNRRLSVWGHGVVVSVSDAQAVIDEIGSPYEGTAHGAEELVRWVDGPEAMPDGLAVWYSSAVYLVSGTRSARCVQLFSPRDEPPVVARRCELRQCRLNGLIDLDRELAHRRRVRGKRGKR